MTITPLQKVLRSDADKIQGSISMDSFWQRHMWPWLGEHYAPFKSESAPSFHEVPDEVLKHANAIRILSDNSIGHRSSRLSSVCRPGTDPETTYPIALEDGWTTTNWHNDEDPRSQMERKFSSSFGGHYMVAYAGGWRIYLANHSASRGGWQDSEVVFDTSKVLVCMPDGEIRSFDTPDHCHMMPSGKAKAVGLKKEGGLERRSFIRQHVIPELDRHFGLVHDARHHMDFLKNHFEVGPEWNVIHRERRERNARTIEQVLAEDPEAGRF